jgi:hypothetical protein
MKNHYIQYFLSSHIIMKYLNFFDVMLFNAAVFLLCTQGGAKCKMRKRYKICTTRKKNIHQQIHVSKKIIFNDILHRKITLLEYLWCWLVTRWPHNHDVFNFHIFNIFHNMMLFIRNNIFHSVTSLCTHVRRIKKHKHKI